MNRRLPPTLLPATVIVTTLGLLPGSGLAEESPASTLRKEVEALRRVPPEELGAKLDEGAIQHSNSQRAILLRIVALDRLLDKDPEGALRRALQVEPTAARVLLQRWAAVDLDAAEQFILSRRAWDHSPRLAMIPVAARVHTDPARALQMIDELCPRMANPIHQGHAVLRAIAEKMPADLLVRSRDWPVGWRDAARAMEFGTRLRKDLPGELRRLSSSRQALLFLKETLRTNPDVASRMREHLRDLPAEGRRALADSTNAANNYSPSVLVWADPLAWLKADSQALGIGAELLEKFQLAAVRSLREKHFASVRELLPKLPDRIAAEALQWTVASLARKDREQAIQWIGELKDAKTRARAQGFLPKSAGPSLWTEPETRSASTVIRKLGEVGDTTDTGVMRSWSVVEEAEAVAAFRKLPEAARGRATKRILAHVVDEMPFGQVGEAWLVRLADDPNADADSSVRALSKLTVLWARNDSQAAAAWVLRLPAGKNRREAMRLLGAVWSEEAPGELKQWGAELKEEDERNLVSEVLEDEE